MHLVVELSNITTITTVGVKTIKVAESRVLVRVLSNCNETFLTPQKYWPLDECINPIEFRGDLNEILTDVEHLGPAKYPIHANNHFHQVVTLFSDLH